MKIIYTSSQAELFNITDAEIREMMEAAKAAVMATRDEQTYANTLARIADGLRYQLADTPAYAAPDNVRHLHHGALHYVSTPDSSGYAIVRVGRPTSPTGYNNNR